jgi:LemA protein
MVIAIVVIAIVVILLLVVVSTYNACVRLKNQGEEAYAQIDAHLKQRYDLIPNLVETVKGYAKHEQGTLTAVIEARNKAMSASGVSEKDKADKAFEGTLKSLFALSEAYPELKANENFKDLQAQLTRLESEILQARKYYNGVVKTFNTKIETFPTSMIVGMFGGKFTKMTYLEVSEAERQNVKVQF